jgi:hypothetical protein
MAKWSDKDMASGGITVDTWNTCQYCNCKEGELHNKFCPTQLSIDPNWPYKVSVREDEDECPDCGDPICDCWLDEVEEFRSVFVKPEYSDLFEVLRDALEQAQEGKGEARHGNGLSFTEQPALTITRAVGLGFPLGQAMKKIQECQRMDPDAAKRELLGAINYLAAAVLFLDENAD